MIIAVTKKVTGEYVTVEDAPLTETEISFIKEFGYLLGGERETTLYDFVKLVQSEMRRMNHKIKAVTAEYGDMSLSLN